MNSGGKMDEKHVLNHYFTSEDYFNKMKMGNLDYEFSRYCSMLKTINKGWILDVGCGVGQVVNRLAKEGFCAVGMDVSPVGLQIATRSVRDFFIIANGIARAKNKVSRLSMRLLI